VRDIPDPNYRLVETGGSGSINGGIMKPQRGPLSEDPEGRVLGMWKQNRELKQQA
jgi:hypothetical protein